MSDIARLGYEIDSSQARTAAKDLMALSAASTKLETSAGRASKAQSELIRNSRGQFASQAEVVARYGSEVYDLAGKYNTAMRAALDYANAEREVARAVALGVINRGQGDAQLASLRAKMAGATAANDAYTNSVRLMNNVQGTAANQFAQMNDVVVTSFGGMSPALIGMQQGMQMVQGLAGQSLPQALGTLKGAFSQLLNPVTLLTIGSVAGAAALIQWGMSAFGASEDAKALEEQVTDLEGATSAHISALEALTMPMDQITEKYGSMTVAARGFLTAMVEIEAVNSANALNAVIAEMTTNLLQLTAANDLGETSYREFAETLGVAEERGAILSATMNLLANAKGPEAQANAARMLADALIASAGSYENMNAAAKQVYDTAIKVGQEATKLSGAIENATTSTDQLNQRLSDAYGLMAATRGEANALAVALAAAATNASSLAYGKVANAGGMDSIARSEMAEHTPDITGTMASGAGGVFRPTGGGGGGGGGKEDPYAKNLERLIDSLRTEREVVDEWYQENLTILEDRRAQEIMGEEAHKAALLDLEKEYQERKSKLGSEYGEFNLGSAEKLFGELYTMSGSQYDGLLKLQKTFGAASALVNTYTAAAQVLADPKLGFWAKFAAVAKTVAAGMGLVNAIKGGGKGGGRGSAGATTSATTASRAEPEKVTRIELMGEEWLVGLAESMIDQIYTASGKGRVIISKANA